MVAAVVAGAMAPCQALADQGGVSFYVPGLFGSFAASPLVPGWSLATIYYHTSVEASGALAAAKQVEIGRLNPRNVPVNLSLDLNLTGRADIVFASPQYVFRAEDPGWPVRAQHAGRLWPQCRDARRHAYRIRRSVDRHAARIDLGFGHGFHRRLSAGQPALECRRA
jgi:hypothetical protein